MTDFYNLDSPCSSSSRRTYETWPRFEFGPSLVDRNHSVDEAVEQGFPVTAELILLASAWAVPVGILLGLFAAVRRGSVLDHLATSTASVLLVVPVFFITYVLSRYFVLEWQLFPVGWDSWEAKVLPVLALGLAPAGYVARLTRAAAVETLQSDYVRTARAKGLRRQRVLGLHVLRNSAIPLLLGDSADARPPHHRALFVESAFACPASPTSSRTRRGRRTIR